MVYYSYRCAYFEKEAWGFTTPTDTMKTLSKLLIFVLVAALALAGCQQPVSEPDPTPEPDPAPAPPTDPDPAPGEHDAVLYAAFHEPDDIKTYNTTYDGELSPDMLANGLSELTGLDFSITYMEQSDGSILIFWNNDSTLIAGLGDGEQKDDFHFFDVDSLNWFMLDSLYYTLKENLDYSAIYYMQEDGQPLSLQDMSPVPPIPANQPYEGSAPYRGDMA